MVCMWMSWLHYMFHMCLVHTRLVGGLLHFKMTAFRWPNGIGHRWPIPFYTPYKHTHYLQTRMRVVVRFYTTYSDMQAYSRIPRNCSGNAPSVQKTCTNFQISGSKKWPCTPPLPLLQWHEHDAQSTCDSHNNQIRSRPNTCWKDCSKQYNQGALPRVRKICM